jgi:hypothetical protein
MIFTLDRDLATCVLYEGLQTKLQSAVDREIFKNAFSAPITDDTILISVEFDRNMFHLQDKDGLHVFESPNDHPTIKFFADNKDQLFNWFLDQENMLKRPSLFHTYNTETHSWVLTAENKNLLDADTARKRRNTLLSQSDWTQVSDVSQTVKDQWSPYRQALRDLPSQAGFPETINWPVAP